MKVNELLGLLSKVPYEDLFKVAVELYKSLPKAVKDDQTGGIDVKIKMILTHQEKTEVHVKKQIVDYDSLHDEIDTFIENAYDDNYIKPNRKISKAQRSKWRFVVMRFVKELQNILPDDSNYDDSNVDLINIFKVLSYGCGYYIFTTDDPFASISKKQIDFYKIICSRIFAKGVDREMIPDMIALSSSVNLDRHTLHTYLINIFLEYINQKDDILYTIKTATEIIDEHKNVSPGNYDKLKELENIAIIVMGLYFKMSEFDMGCEYYWKTCEKYKINIAIYSEDKNKEVVFYCLLQYISNFNDSKSLWVKYYEKYVNGITPRDSLVNKYNELKESLS